MIVGILGSGQLARMMILSAKYLGLEFVLYTPEVTATTRNLAKHVIGELDDLGALSHFCQQVDVITYESENMSKEALDFLQESKPVYPSISALETMQDRLLEKSLFEKLGVNTNQFCMVDNYFDLEEAIEKLGFPLVLKARRFGYDGKHQYRVYTRSDLKALESVNLKGFIAESFVDFDYEVSIIGVRSATGEIRCYDLCKNHHEHGILRETRNIVEPVLFEKAKAHLQTMMQHFNYVGVLTIEFFVKGDTLFANEMAPRVHNSGHWTIEGARCSQFENHVRAICEWPLGDTQSLAPYVMTNAIGTMPNRNETLVLGGAFHDYQKTPRENRKLGHVTFCDEI